MSLIVFHHGHGWSLPSSLIRCLVRKSTSVKKKDNDKHRNGGKFILRESSELYPKCVGSVMPPPAQYIMQNITE